MARSKYKFFGNDTPYFLTCTVVDWIPLLEESEVKELILASMRFMQTLGRLKIHAYVVMIDHLHMIASSESISEEIRHFKSFTATRIVEYLEHQQATPVLNLLADKKAAHKIESSHQVWQEGSHPEAISGRAMMNQKIEYIHYNPVKAGYVKNMEDWPYSSARNYAGQHGLLEIDMIEW